MYVQPVEPVKAKCPFCFEYFTGYIKEDGTLITGFCSRICEDMFRDAIRSFKIKKICSRMGKQ